MNAYSFVFSFLVVFVVYALSAATA